MKCPYLVLILAFSLALASCGENSVPKMYSATAKIQLRPWGNPSIFPYNPTFNDPPDPPNVIAGQIKENMLSAETLTQITQDLKLDLIWAKRFKSDHDALSPQEALGHLRNVLKIEVVPGTMIFKITAVSEVPQEAADIANAFAGHYKAFRDRVEAERASREEESLRDQITQQQKVVADAKAAAQKKPQDTNCQRDLQQQQSLLGALKVCLNQVIADRPLVESPVRIISRAVAPPE